MLNLSNFIKILIVCLLIWLCLELQHTRENDWCSSEIDHLKSQLSDIWFHLGLDQ